jgi:hypothetical protein
MASSIEMVENDLPFKKRTAQMFMAVARDLRLRKAKTSSLLPPYWNTLYKITRLSDAMLERLIDDGTIRPDTGARWWHGPGFHHRGA